MGFHLTVIFSKHSDIELYQLAERVSRILEVAFERMIDKEDVAHIANMSVTWLNTSQSKKAKRLRALATKYDTSKTSPTKYPLLKVSRICQQDEGRTK